jgi:hypothetical protein
MKSSLIFSQACITSSLVLANLLHLGVSTSSSTSRPPFSLSTIINDLEAEGAPRGICTSTVLASQSVTASQKTEFLKDLLCHGLSDEEKGAALEEVEDDGLTTVGRLVDGVGVAFACAESPSQSASTAMACGKNLVYLCTKLDLTRGEGLFDTLAPAIEAAANYNNGNEIDGEEGSEGGFTLIVLLPCSGEDPSSMAALKEKFNQAASGMLSNLATKATSLTDIFTNVLFLPQSSSSTCKEILSKLASEDANNVFRNPSEASAAIASVAKATFNLESLFYSVGAGAVKTLTPEEVASVRVALPATRSAMNKAHTAVSDRSTTEDGSAQLVANFGELCDAAYLTALESFDEAVGQGHQGGGTALTKKLRNELSENIVMEFETVYEGQLAELKIAMFEKCRRELSGLRVSPNLASDMEEKMKEAQTEFNTIAAQLIPKTATTSSSWSSFGNAAQADFKRTTKEYCTERLLAAKASGAFKPVPRKAISVGLHWLLPRPFGSDHRQATLPNEVRRNYVYHSPEGRSEVSPDEVKQGSGAWKNKIVPTPTASDMLY